MNISELWGQVQDLVDKEIGGKYISFKGRITRRQYCVYSATVALFVTFAALIMGLAFLAIMIATKSYLAEISFLTIAIAVISIFVCFWTLSFTVRRLHDTGHTGTFLIAVVFAFFLYLIILGTAGAYWLNSVGGKPTWSFNVVFSLVSACFDIGLGAVSWMVLYRRGNIGTNAYGPDLLPDNVQEPEAKGSVWQELLRIYAFYLKNWKTIFWTRQGRLNRKQYFYCTVGLFVLHLGIRACLGIIGAVFPFETLMNLINGVIMFCIACMQICITIRRFHDYNLSGWNSLWLIVPFIQIMVGLKLTAMRGQPGDNKYGVDTITAGESDDF